MKAMQIEGAFGLDNLKLAERDEPRPGPGQIAVRMRAASLNYRDLLMVRGHYNPKLPLPVIPCSDGVGEVVALGDGVERVSKGDRVCPIFVQRWLSGQASSEALRSTLGGPLDGTLTETMVVDADGVVHVPEHLTDVEAAALPCAYVTAWSALVTYGDVKAGDTVVVQGTGGVSVAALQLAQLLGARVIVTSSSNDKLERARTLGAWQGINYRETPDWGKRVRALTDGLGADHVVEVGGAGTLAQSLAAVRPQGQISVIGVLTGVASELNILPILMQGLRLQGVFVGHREGFESMNRAIGVHELRPVVDRTFGLEDARDAFETMAAAKHFGKICITL